MQNKVLPGAYINFVSAARATSALSDRGIVAIAVESDWGTDGEVVLLENSEFHNNTMKYFGYPYEAEQLKGMRDLFRNAKSAYVYRLNSGTKASNQFAAAKCSGIRGNDLKTAIRANVEEPEKFDVETWLGTVLVDRQVAADAAGLVPNDYVVFKADAALEVTAGEAMTGGTNSAAVTGNNYQTFLNKMESCSFHVLACTATDDSIKELFVAYTKRMRDEMGIKFQTVLYQAEADTEGVISIKNKVLDEGAKESSLVYWVSGASAGCAVNATNTNKKYDGEFRVMTDYRQYELEEAINSGFFTFHRAGNETRVLEDINSLITADVAKDGESAVSKSRDFTSNQVIRVLDQIGNDIAVIFKNRYLGKVQNNEAGRTGLWNDIVNYHRELEKLGATEKFDSKDITVEPGTDKKSVVVTSAVTPVCSMSKLYMTVTVQ